MKRKLKKWLYGPSVYVHKGNNLWVLREPNVPKPTKPLFKTLWYFGMGILTQIVLISFAGYLFGKHEYLIWLIMLVPISILLGSLRELFKEFKHYLYYHAF